MLSRVDHLYEFRIEMRDEDDPCEDYEEGSYCVRVIDQTERNLNIYVTQHGGSFEDYFSLGMYAGMCWIADYVNETAVFISDIDNIEDNAEEFLDNFNTEPLEATALAEIFRYLVHRECNEISHPSAGKNSHYRKQLKDPFEITEGLGIDPNDLPFPY